MKFKIYTFLLVSLFAFLFYPNFSFAHSGRTDAYGCHNCRVGSCAGEYHCHNGGYSSPPETYYIPEPTPTPAILGITASINYDYNISRNQYSIKFDWDDVPGSQGYSISLTRSPGLDPGPLVDTTKSARKFNNASGGRWYANLKSLHGSSWSQIVYWTIDLPVKKTVTQTIEPTPTSKPALNTKVTSYTCNCSKTCTQIYSCAEAYYQLNNCGCTIRDGDKDGIPCENLCR